MPVWDPHNQSVAGLTDPDDPILLHRELDLENERRAREQDRECEQQRQEEAARAAAARSGATPDARDARAPGSAASPAAPSVAGRREPRLDAAGQARDPEQPDESAILTGSSGKFFPLAGAGIALVLIIAALWLFAPRLMPRGKPAPAPVADSAARPASLPVVASDAPLSSPRDVGELGAPLAADLLADPLPDVETAALPEPTESPEGIAAADLPTVLHVAAAADEPAQSALADQVDALQAGFDELRDSFDALSAKLDGLEHANPAHASFRLEALEQRLEVVQEQVALSQASAERAVALGVAAERAVRERPRPSIAAAPAKPAPRAATQPPAPAQSKPKAQPADPGVQLLTIDSWGGEPSIIVGTTAPGPVRTRTLTVGDTINGITLRAVDARLGIATFDVGGGELRTLTLGGAGGRP